MLPQPVGFLKLIFKLFGMIYIQKRDFCFCDLIKYAFNIDLHLDTCEPICFEPGMMLDRTRLYGMIPVLMTLI